jgi:pantoate--beta-alanine ligase
VRESDGLALSSRNQYLLPVERGRAPALYRTLSEVARRVQAGMSPAEAEAWGTQELGGEGFDQVDYVAVRDADTLAPATATTAAKRVLGAAWMGMARLIDNVPGGA